MLLLIWLIQSFFISMRAIFLLSFQLIYNSLFISSDINQLH